jgi:uncharacterized protein YndB with AHSA1/START domain
MLKEEMLAAESNAPGTVAVTVEVQSPPEAVWRSLTEPDVVAHWFGRLSEPLRSGGTARLDFGDGDFFNLESIELDPPTLLRYRWRFLAIGRQDTVTWRLELADGGCRVTVTDSEPGRTREAAMMLREGWLDFTKRLVDFHATGEPTRYDWRRELDVSAEILNASLDGRLTLSSPGLLANCLPFETPLQPGGPAEVSDGLQPRTFRLSDVTWRSENQIEFQLSGDGWAAPTTCQMNLQRRPADLLLNVSHNGWEQISPDPAEQLRQRKRFCAIWIAAFKRARRHVAQMP